MYTYRGRLRLSGLWGKEDITVAGDRSGGADGFCHYICENTVVLYPAADDAWS